MIINKSGSYNDSVLVAKMLKGDEGAFEYVYRKWFEKVYNYSKEFVVSEDIANEVAQDVFMVLWENRKQLAPSTIFYTYLLKIARNKCLNTLRHNKVCNDYIKNKKDLAKELEMNYWSLADSGAEKLLEKELREVIDKAVDRLPEKCQNVFKLSRYEGLKYKEISDKLGISVKTVETYMTQSLKQLRKDLKDFLPLIVMVLGDILQKN